MDSNAEILLLVLTSDTTTNHSLRVLRVAVACSLCYVLTECLLHSRRILNSLTNRQCDKALRKLYIITKIHLTDAISSFYSKLLSIVIGKAYLMNIIIHKVKLS